MRAAEKEEHTYILVVPLDVKPVPTPTPSRLLRKNAAVVYNGIRPIHSRGSGLFEGVATTTVAVEVHHLVPEGVYLRSFLYPIRNIISAETNSGTFRTRWTIPCPLTFQQQNLLLLHANTTND